MGQGQMAKLTDTTGSLGPRASNSLVWGDEILSLGPCGALSCINMF